MSSHERRRRIEKLEKVLAKLNNGTSTPEEIIAALKGKTATPAQLGQVWAAAGDDIRTQVIRLAVNRRFFYADGGSYRGTIDNAPVTRAIEILSHRAAQPLSLSDYLVPTYDPEAWADPEAARKAGRFVPFHGFKAWARTFLMDRLLGPDGGLALRAEIDEWLEGGEPVIDVYRYPHESVYWLVLPIDGNTRTMFDARMLRLPTAELHERIGIFPNFGEPECWDTPEGRHLWTPEDTTGFEWF